MARGYGPFAPLLLLTACQLLQATSGEPYDEQQHTEGQTGHLADVKQVQATQIASNPSMNRRLLRPGTGVASTQLPKLDNDDEQDNAGSSWRVHQDELQGSLHRKLGYLRGLTAYTSGRTAVHHPARNQVLLDELAQQHEQLDEDAKGLAAQQAAAHNTWQQHVLELRQRRQVHASIIHTVPGNTVPAPQASSLPRGTGWLVPGVASRTQVMQPGITPLHNPASCVNIRLADPEAESQPQVKTLTTGGLVSSWMPGEQLTGSSMVESVRQARGQSQPAGEQVSRKAALQGRQLIQAGSRSAPISGSAVVWQLLFGHTGDREL